MPTRLLTLSVLSIAITLAACASVDRTYHSATKTPPPLRYEASCSPESYDLTMYGYSANLQNIKDAARRNLYSKSLAARTDSDRKLVGETERDIRMLEGDIQSGYDKAVESCEAFLRCEGGLPGPQAPACEAERASMILAETNFTALDGRLASMSARIAELESVKPVPYHPEKKPDGDPDKGPELSSQEVCPTISGYLALCSDDD